MHLVQSSAYPCSPSVLAVQNVSVPVSLSQKRSTLTGHFALNAMSMTSVRLSVTLVDCDHIVQEKVEIGTGQDRSVGVLTTCMPTPIRIAGVCGKYGVLHFCSIQRLACCAISASTELFVLFLEQLLLN